MARVGALGHPKKRVSKWPLLAPVSFNPKKGSKCEYVHHEGQTQDTRLRHRHVGDGPPVTILQDHALITPQRGELVGWVEPVEPLRFDQRNICRL